MFSGRPRPCGAAEATVARPAASRPSRWRSVPCLDTSRCEAISPRVACPRVFRKARIVSRLESTKSSYEFFNIHVEIPVRGRDTLRPMRRLLAVLVAAPLAIMPAPANAADPAWESWKSFPGVFDVDGPRSDGSLLVA